jgi:DUF1009 family protein
VTGAPIGLIAGSGRLPVLFAQAAERAGRAVVTIAHEGETDPSIDAKMWVKLGQLGRIVEVLREAGVSEAVLCGAIGKPRLFDVRPDWLGLKVLARLRGAGDDAALRGIAEALEEEGIRIVSPLPLVPELLVRHGPLGKLRLTDDQRADAVVGLVAARTLGQADVGQTVVVKRGVVLAAEAVEGTDACIARGGAFAPGAVVVKARKPQQDDRFDVPTVGPGTIETCASARCGALVVEAGTTLVVDRSETVMRADRAGMAVEGI